MEREQVFSEKNLEKDKKKRKLKRNLFILSILAIPVVHWLVFWLYVNLNSILLAFKLPSGSWSIETLKQVVNELFEPNSDLGIALKNTMAYFIKDVIMLFWQLIIAYLFYKKITWHRFFRIVFYLPAIISAVTMVTMFRAIIGSEGVVAKIFEQLNLEFPKLLRDSRYATKTIMFFTIWIGWGGEMLVLGGAFERIPAEVLEAAKLDGVGPVRELTQLIVPMIWPTISTLLILYATGLFNASGPIFLFGTKGSYETWTLSYWIFHKVLYGGSGQYNTVSAMGLIFTCIGVPIVMFVRWLFERVIPAVEY